MTNAHPLTFEDRPLVNTYLTRHPPIISELTFTNLFAWRHSRPIRFAEFGNALLFFTANEAGEILLGNPVGPVSLVEVLEEYGNRLAGVERFPADLLGRMPDESITISDDRANADYLYRTEALANLAGRQFAKKRNLVSRCLANYDCKYEIINPDLLPECLAMQQRWCRERNCISEMGLAGEDRAIEAMLRHYEEFGLIGGAIRIAGRIEAFSLGERLNPSTAVCHVEKAMPGFIGLGQLINQWFARFSLPDFTFVNREQDLGIPGLRQAKESYFPERLIQKLRIRPLSRQAVGC